MSEHSAPGRRSAARRTRVNPTAVLAVVLPLLTAAAVWLVRPAEHQAAVHPPETTNLTSATLVCPSSLPGARTVEVTSAAADVGGSVSVGLGADGAALDIASGRVASVVAAGPTVVTGTDDTAPGLVATRIGEDEVATGACITPRSEQWFTGVGAGAGHTSVLELTNPDAGTARADVTVYAGAGIVDAPRLRDVSVPGHSTIRLDLSRLIPRRGDLALEVNTVRGRIGASLLDRFDRVGSAPLTRDWLAAQTEPTTEGLLLGLASGTGPRVLVLANGGDDEARAEVRVVTADSVFAPEGLDEVRIPPHSVRAVTLTAELADVGKDALGLAVSSSEPVTATLRSETDGDLSHAVIGQPIEGTATALLPSGTDRGRTATDKTLVVAGADRAGTVTVVSRAADGTELDTQTVEITPDHGVAVDLPADAVLVTATPARTRVTGSILVARRDGATVVPLVVAPTNGLVPDVRPGLP